MPVEVEVHTAPHFKAPVSSKVEPRQLECGGVFISYTAYQIWVFYYIKWTLSKMGTLNAKKSIYGN